MHLYILEIITGEIDRHQRWTLRRPC